MALKIIWSPHAIADLEAIANYISHDSQSYAASMIQRLVNAVETAALFPLMGREVPELSDPDIRELIVRKYRLIYRVESDAIKIGSVIHGARDFEKALHDRPNI